MKNIFIVGVGRSGTSLLHSMIGAHPHIVAIPETSFLRSYVFSESVDIEELKQFKKIDRLAELRESLIETDYQPEHFISSYAKALERLDSPFVVDKDPRLVEYIPFLKKAFPDCKIVHIYRDPRDVLASKKLAAWSSGRSLVSYLVASRVQVLDALTSETSNLIYSIKYEELIEDPKKVLTGVCKFLEVEYNHSLLSFGHVAKKLVTEEEFSWKKETLKPVITGNHGKWTETLNVTEAMAAEKIVPELIKKGDYLPTEGSLGFVNSLNLIVVVGLTRLLTSFYVLKRKSRYGKIMQKLKIML